MLPIRRLRKSRPQRRRCGSERADRRGAAPDRGVMMLVEIALHAAGGPAA